MANGRPRKVKVSRDQETNGDLGVAQASLGVDDGQLKGLRVPRLFTRPDVHPYDEIEWERRKASLVARGGKVSFEQDDVEFPASWSQNATNIVAEKYFRGKLGTASREWSVKQIIDRVVDSIAEWGDEQSRFASEDDREAFRAELKSILVNQRASFNSPVWFNIGVPGRAQQASACQPYHALVSTPDGLVPIGRLVEENAVGAKVHDAHGVTKVVAVKANGTKAVLRVHTSSGHTLDVTSDHLVWRDGDGFVEAGQLTAGDRLEWHRTESWGEGQIDLREIAKARELGEAQVDRDDDTTVPVRVLDAPLPVAAAYVEGLFSGLGRVAATHIECDHVSEYLVRGAQTLLARFGILAEVTFKPYARPDCRGVWSLVIRDAASRRRFADEIGFTDGREHALEATFTDDEAGPVGICLLDVARIEPLGPMDVYDIQTESGEYLSQNLRVHNCFILHVDDNMESIADWYRDEMFIFKGGSGSGLNVSNLRSSYEQLAIGGYSSGPVSFMRGADAAAGTIKSGGATRRAAKMVVMNVDHPDLIELRDGSPGFVWTKSVEERKARALKTAGFDMDVDSGVDAYSLQYQNANNSVRLTDEFMDAYLEDRDWHLRAVTTGDVIQTYQARDVMQQIAQAAWDCADPGVQYHTTINDWHTAPAAGPITASNPCFTGDTLVHTDKGLIRFDELVHRAADGETFGVYTHDATNPDEPAERVEITSPDAYMVTGTNEVWRVTLDNGIEIKCTPNHRFFTLNRGMVEARELTEDDQVKLLNVPTPAIGADWKLPVSTNKEEYLGKGDWRQLEFNLPEKWDEELAYYMGWLIGDGCISGNVITTVYASPEKEEILDRHMRLVKWLNGGREPKIHEMSNGTLQLRLSRRPLARFFRALGVKDGRAHQKEIPWSIFQSPTPVVASFLRGLYDADGCVVEGSTNYVGFATTSIKLSQGVQKLLATFGLESRRYTYDKKPRSFRYTRKDGTEVEYHSKATHDLRMTGSSLVHFSRDIGFDLLAKSQALCEMVVDHNFYKSKGYAKVRSKEFVGFETTYNLSEPRNHSYAIHGVIARNCSEYLHLDNSPCNLASLNLLKFLNDDLSFDTKSFEHAVQIVLLGQAILCVAADYPTDKITKNARGFRELGIGYANLGALLMALGVPYESDEGRAWAAGVTALMQGAAYRASARFAEVLGPFPGTDELPGFAHPENRDATLRVLRKHAAFAKAIAEVPTDDDRKLDKRVDVFHDEVIGAGEPVAADAELAKVVARANEVWEETLSLAERFGVENSQVSVAAPTGTIAFYMDCDTTGIEPDLALKKVKKLVGGGTMSIVNQTVPRALRRLGYEDEQIEAIVAYIDDENTVVGAPALKPEHYPVFACSFTSDNLISHMGHIQMMAAIQPSISGALSKTVNVPEAATVEDVEEIYREGWRLGLKALAIYRDNCKADQPLSADKKKAIKGIAAVETATAQPVRKRLPKSRPSMTYSFRVADCDGYVHVGLYPETREPGEIFIKVAKQGSTLAGVMDAFAISISMGLQYGVPLEAYVEKFMNMIFEPRGITDDPDIRFAASLMDFIFRKLALEFLSPENRASLGIRSTAEREDDLNGANIDGDFERVDETDEGDGPASSAEIVSQPAVDAPLCVNCGVKMRPSGNCFACELCGSTSGCS